MTGGPSLVSLQMDNSPNPRMLHQTDGESAFREGQIEAENERNSEANEHIPATICSSASHVGVMITKDPAALDCGRSPLETYCNKIDEFSAILAAACREMLVVMMAGYCIRGKLSIRAFTVEEYPADRSFDDRVYVGGWKCGQRYAHGAVSSVN